MKQTLKNSWASSWARTNDSRTNDLIYSTLKLYLVSPFRYIYICIGASFPLFPQKNLVSTVSEIINNILIVKCTYYAVWGKKSCLHNFLDNESSNHQDWEAAKKYKAKDMKWFSRPLSKLTNFADSLRPNLFFHWLICCTSEVWRFMNQQV